MSIDDSLSFSNYDSFAGSRFLCSEVIAPVKSDVDDISLFIINFEDLTVVASPVQDESPAMALSKCMSLN